MKQATAEQKRWTERIARFADEHGCFPHNNETEYQLHHVVGRSAKHNKVAIGHWFIIPVETKYHDVHSNNPWNVTHFRKRYQLEFSNQRDQFYSMCMVIKDEDDELPFGDDVLHAILDTRY